MDIEFLIQKNPKLKFLKSAEFQAFSQETREYIIGLVEDVYFWRDHDAKPNSGDGFKFLAASYGLENATAEADAKALEGKDREKFLRPHQDLYTVFNPYSGNGRETQKKP